MHSAADTAPLEPRKVPPDAPQRRVRAERSDTVRDRVVDVLERTWGPILVGLAFGFLFATQDPAQEVILGFVREFGPPDGDWTDMFRPSAGGIFSEFFCRSTFSILLLGALPVAIL
jgi:hypothetical protein